MTESLGYVWIGQSDCQLCLNSMSFPCKHAQIWEAIHKTQLIKRGAIASDTRWNVRVAVAAAALHLDVVLQGHSGLHKVLSFYEDKFVLLHLAHCSLVHPCRHNRLLEVGRGKGRGWSRGTWGGRRQVVSTRCKPLTPLI